MKAFADVVIGDKIQYGASDLFRTVTNIEINHNTNHARVTVEGGAMFSVDARAWVFCIEGGK